jgi:hypothetical protein
MSVGPLDDDVLCGCLLPVQFNVFARGRRFAFSEGERKLLAAILADAIHCYIANRNHKTREQHLRFLEVKRWFEHRGVNSGEPKGFAYETICDVLGIEPELLRKRLPLTDVNEIAARRRRRSGPDAV